MRSKRGRKIAGIGKAAIYSLLILGIAAGGISIWNPLQLRDIAEDQIHNLIGKVGGNADSLSQKPLIAVRTAAADQKGSIQSAPASPVSTAVAKDMKKTVLTQASGKLKVDASLAKLIQQMDGLSINSNQTFSFGNELNKAGLAGKLQEAQLSYAASLLYQCAVQAGLDIGQRYIHNDLPDYVNPGYDTAIDQTLLRQGGIRKDLSFANSSPYAITIKTEIQNGLPLIAFEAVTPADWSKPTIRISKESFHPEEIKLVDFTLAEGVSVKEDEGKDGLLIKVTGESAQKGILQLISKDFYPPHPIVTASGPTAEQKAK